MIDPLSSLSIPLPSSPPVSTLPTRKLLTPVPNDPDSYVLEIDNSSLEPFTVCPRKAENKLVRSREAARDESAQQFGRLFHQCEELRLRHGLNDNVRAKQAELVRQHFIQHPVDPSDHRTAQRMLDVLNKYNVIHAADAWPERMLRDANGEVLVERPFKIELCTIPLNCSVPYTAEQLLSDTSNAKRTGSEDVFESGFFIRNLHVLWTGRIDAVISEAGQTFVIDHKTTSTGGREFEEAFHLATQTVGYAWAAQQILGSPVAGLIVNAVLIRPPLKTSPKAGGLAREEFNRFSYLYSQDRISEWYDSVRYIVADFVGCLVRGFFPMAGPKSFKSPCVYCEYHENCRLPRAQRAADLASDLYRNVVWTPIFAD